MPVFPITFSIHESKIINEIPIKTKIVSSIIPNNTCTYTYNTEEEYYNEYKSSLFALTMKKAGWDCMRHYEIIANGCIPYFIDIEKCPENTLALFPKDLIIKGNNLYEKHKNKKNINELTITEYNECLDLINKLVSYLRNNLTTKKIANYVLEKSNSTNAKNILFLSARTDTDYLRCLILTGFKEIFGAKCHDYPKIEHIYKNEDNYTNLYGRGFTYSKIIDKNERNNDLDITVINDIYKHKYDLIIFGACHRGLPFDDKIVEYILFNYPQNKIILLCGEDIHDCDHKHLNKYNIFIREL
jgi:hypothetical protein